MPVVIPVTPAFKKASVQAVLAILLFIIVYLILVLATVFLVCLLGWFAMMLIQAHPSLWTLLIGAALLAMGVLVFIFLVKFVFKRHKTDRSSFIELKKSDQPELFELLQSIVKEVNTIFPKKVYLSAEVNASVFYDSSFWSMFFPVRKNLNIGLGLVKAVSQNEFKAILAHEFGHFSQSSMKVSSYVYQTNRIVHDMLCDNDRYTDSVVQLGELHAFLSFAVLGAFRINQIIIEILKNCAKIIGKNHMKLSREMEFQADAVAAQVAGSNAISSGLLRIDFADAAFQYTLGFFNRQLQEGTKISNNIFPSYHLALQKIALNQGIKLERELPVVHLRHYLQRFKSKLVIENQWASHPTMLERIDAVKIYPEQNPAEDLPAIELFRHPDALEKQLTAFFYSELPKDLAKTTIEETVFQQFISKDFSEEVLPECYNGYYNEYFPQPFDLENPPAGQILERKDLFSDQAVGHINQLNVMQADLDLLGAISEGQIDVSSFDYDGIKYKASGSKALMARLEKDLNELKNAVSTHDSDLYRTFLDLATTKGLATELKCHYQTHFDCGGFIESAKGLHTMMSFLSFSSVTQKVVDIQKMVEAVEQAEPTFKEEINRLINEAPFAQHCTEHHHKVFQAYQPEEWLYFSEGKYISASLTLLQNTVEACKEIILATLRRLKLDLLTFQAELLESSE